MGVNVCTHCKGPILLFVSLGVDITFWMHHGPRPYYHCWEGLAPIATPKFKGYTALIMSYAKNYD